jgi:hypothetical protein
MGRGRPRELMGKTFLRTAVVNDTIDPYHKKKVTKWRLEVMVAMDMGWMGRMGDDVMKENIGLINVVEPLWMRMQL